MSLLTLDEFWEKSSLTSENAHNAIFQMHGTCLWLIVIRTSSWHDSWAHAALQLEILLIFFGAFTRFHWSFVMFTSHLIVDYWEFNSVFTSKLFIVFSCQIVHFKSSSHCKHCWLFKRVYLYIPIKQTCAYCLVYCWLPACI